MKIKIKIPEIAKEIGKRINAHNGEAYIVGGFVRDSLSDELSKDIDIFTNLLPEKIKEIFPEGVVLGTSKRLEKIFTIIYKGVEINTFRKDGERKEFGTNIIEHCSTCDFTVNSIALNIKTEEIYDPNNGREDLKENLLRFVGHPQFRIKEDPIRMLRAIRFIATRDYKIHHMTLYHIQKQAHIIKTVSVERIKDEFEKLILGRNMINTLDIMYKSDLMLYLFPEMVLCKGHICGKSHTRDVFNHISSAVQFAPKVLSTRLALFFHDQGKTITFDGERFLGHEFKSKDIAGKRLRQYRFKKTLIKRVCTLVENHMFSARYKEENELKIMSEKAIRKLFIKFDGDKELLLELLDIRDADRLSNSDRPPLNELRNKVMYFLEQEQAIKTSDLRVNGKDVIKILNLEPGPKVGKILKQLFNEVIDNQEKNKREFLLKRIEAIKQ